MDPNYFNPSMYENRPVSEVNWAQLAQRWIMSRNLTPSNLPPAPRPLMSGMVQPPAFSTPFIDPRSMAPNPNTFTPMPLNPLGIYPSPQSGFFSGSGMMNTIPPPRIPYPSPVRNNVGPSTSYGEPNYMYEDEEEQYGAHFDPSLTSDEPTEEGAMSHWISGMSESNDQSELPQDWMDSSWMPNAIDTSKYNSSGIPSLLSLPFLDHQARKKLPAWILEGLEKAEKEKQRKLEKEERLKEAEKNAKLRQEQRAALGLSKFDSDSDNESDKETEDGATMAHSTKNLSLPEEPIFLAKRDVKEAELQSGEKLSDSEIDEEKLEELRQLGLVTIRRLMTAVLLESTDEELNRITSQVYSDSKRRAQPKILAQSSALAALSALGDGESDSSSEEETNTPVQNGQNNRVEKEDGKFKTPFLPPVQKIKSGDFSNGSNLPATVAREDSKLHVDQNKVKNDIAGKQENNSDDTLRHTKTDQEREKKSHRDYSNQKRSRSRSRERSSSKKDRNEDRKRDSRHKDSDRRHRHDSSESSKKHKRREEERKRTRSRSKSREHRPSKHSRRRTKHSRSRSRS